MLMSVSYSTCQSQQTEPSDQSEQSRLVEKEEFRETESSNGPFSEGLSSIL